MASEELRELLQKLGFTSYEAKAYVTLVVNGPLTATELASRSEIPQPRVYDVVQSLSEKGLILVSEGRPRKFAAVDPLIALRNYVERRRAEEEKILREVLREIGSITPQTAEPGVWTTTGYASAVNLLGEAVASARDELLFSGYTDVVKSFLLPALKHELATCVVLYDAPVDLPEEFRQLDEVRVKPTKAPVMAIPDFQYALIIVDFEGGRPVAYKVTDENLIRIFAVYYLNYIRAGSKPVFDRLSSIDHRRYVHLSRALDHVRALSSAGRRIRVTVTGRWVKDGSHAKVTGEVVEQFENSYRSIGYIRLRTGDGRELTVGGIGAYLEDIEAREIEIFAL
ncbi:TrmB family transcriptional regulator [Infirmifilum sp. SLHALR2]|nr:MAG: hypothetical protein B7L53_00270 [Thermofilum sp. NZ13]